jgi:hypothetical protein
VALDLLVDDLVDGAHGGGSSGARKRQFYPDGATVCTFKGQAIP